MEALRTAIESSWTAKQLNETHYSYVKNDQTIVFQQVWQMFPSLTWMYPWPKENEFDGQPIMNFMMEAWQWPLMASVVYIAVIFWIKFINKESFSLKYPLFFWNLFLAVFSIMGMLRTVPYSLEFWRQHGFHALQCQEVHSVYQGAHGLWNLLFIWSKFPELVDTLFIVLRRKPLIFLHWYHHFTVMILSFYVGATQSPFVMFASMNYTVHAIMYTYYALAAIHCWPKFIPPWLITVLQTSQMVGGMANCIFALMHHDDCPMAHKPTLYLAFAIYATYFILFAQILPKVFSRKSKMD